VAQTLSSRAFQAGLDHYAAVGYREYPLSGEWAGESIPELSDRYDVDLWDMSLADRFEDGFHTRARAEAARETRRRETNIHMRLMGMFPVST